MKKYLNNRFDVDRLIDVFDELPLWSAPFGLKLLEAIEYKPGISAIDIGFGTGFPLIEIAMRLGERAIVYGIDPWEEAQKRAHRKIEAYGLSNVKILCGTAESIPLDDHSIDLITSNNGLNNVSDIEKAIAECSRIMKRGGQFVQTMNTDLSMFEFYRHLKQVLRESGMEDEIETMRRHIALKRPPIDRIAELLVRNGFEINDLEQSQFVYKFADGTTMLNHYFIGLAFLSAWIKLVPENRLEQIFHEIETRLNDEAHLVGGVTLSVPFVVINATKR